MANPPYPLVPEPMKKSWIERHPGWKIPLGCVILLLLIAIWGTITATVITASFRHNEVYKQALARAAADPQVREQMGDPIQPDWLVSGKIRDSGGNGGANFIIPISGPLRRGRIRAVASKIGGVWRFTCLQVDVAGQAEGIDLLAAPAPPGP